jgi:hypothetical protein
MKYKGTKPDGLFLLTWQPGGPAVLLVGLNLGLDDVSSIRLAPFLWHSTINLRQ